MKGVGYPVNFVLVVVSLALLAPLTHSRALETSLVITPPPENLRTSLNLSPFYKKYLNAGGLPVVSSEKVSDFALKEAAYIVQQMLAGREEILEAIARQKVRLVVMSPTEMTTDVPEHSDLRPKDYWDKRARGLGATTVRPAVSCGEENLLEYAGDPYATENILVHEFGHVVHEFGMKAIDPTFDRRLQETFDKAMQAGLWKNTYAATNRHEYWAEGVQSWFDTNRENDSVHNHVNTRAELKAYDGELAKLLNEVFGDREWRYVKPSKRQPPSPHLIGYDPKNAPKFQWPPRLVPLFNGSFEETDNHQPKGWRTHTWAGKADFQLSDVARRGSRSVMISSEQGADAAWYVVVPVKPFSTYRLSAWIKTENLEPLDGAGALLNLHARRERTQAITGTRDWTQVQTEIQTGSEDALWINCLIGYFGRAKGKAWFDDVRLELVSTMEVNPTVTINAATTGEPISKYIYGQFIEHLGRCIYGGIWAEMLEDRKFYYAVGAAPSPWKSVGGAVKMDAKNPFVGEHTPVISPTGDGKPAGIMQGDLALIQGKKYVGRIWLAGDASASPVQVSLVWGDGANERQTVTVSKLSRAFVKTPLHFTAGATTNNARLEITSTGKGSFRIGTVSLMPADNVRGMRADTLKLLQELNAPIYRWPGGNFVSGYDWRDGIGDPDRRPPRKNPAWQGVEHNDFGIDEFIAFCREVNAEPLVVVNTGFGDAHSAAQEVEYCNGAKTTPMGKWRAQNGHPAPYRVKWWGIGNEMYGNWQLGHMSLNHYVLKHKEVVRKMRQVDPTIKTIAVGDAGRWSEGMLSHCADDMDYISEHFYCQERPSVMSHVAQIPDAIKRKVEAHRRYRETIPALKGLDIRIAMDEWNYWYGPHLYGELGTRYFLKDALGIAAGLHEFFRSSDLVFMANYAQTVNVIGCIKTTKTDAAFETTGLVLKLYRQHYGTIPVPVSGNPPPLDVAAALTPDRQRLTLSVVNPTSDNQTLALKFEGVTLTGSGKRYQIAGNDPMAYNEPGQPPNVVIQESAVRSLRDALSLPPFSVTLWVLEAR